MKQAISALTDMSKAQGGVTVAGERYILVRNDPGVMLIMKKGQSGLVAYKSAQCKQTLFNHIYISKIMFHDKLRHIYYFVV